MFNIASTHFEESVLKTFSPSFIIFKRSFKLVFEVMMGSCTNFDSSKCFVDSNLSRWCHLYIISRIYNFLSLR